MREHEVVSLDNILEEVWLIRVPYLVAWCAD